MLLKFNLQHRIFLFEHKILTMICSEIVFNDFNTLISKNICARKNKAVITKYKNNVWQYILVIEFINCTVQEANLPH